MNDSRPKIFIFSDQNGRFLKLSFEGLTQGDGWSETNRLNNCQCYGQVQARMRYNGEPSVLGGSGILVKGSIVLFSMPNPSSLPTRKNNAIYPLMTPYWSKFTFEFTPNVLVDRLGTALLPASDDSFWTKFALTISLYVLPSLPSSSSP